MCSLKLHGSVLVLKLLGNGQHLLNPSFLWEISSALDKVEAEYPSATALVTTNEGKYFCTGMELDYLKQDPAFRLPSLAAQFEYVLLQFMKLGIPTIAAICGHAVGAGLILALAHDYRYMRKDRGFIFTTAGGMALLPAFTPPKGSFSLPRCKLAPAVYREVFLSRKKLTGIKAFELGVVDGLFDNPESTIQAAITKAQELAENSTIDKETYRSLRKGMYEEVMEELQVSEETFLHDLMNI